MLHFVETLLTHSLRVSKFDFKMEGKMKCVEPLALDIGDDSTDEEEEECYEPLEKLAVKDLPKTIPEAKAALKKEESKADAIFKEITHVQSEQGWEQAWEANPHFKNLHPSFLVHSGNANVLKCHVKNLDDEAEEICQELVDLSHEKDELKDKFDIERTELDKRHEKTQEALQISSDKLQEILKVIRAEKKTDKPTKTMGATDWMQTSLQRRRRWRIKSRRFRPNWTRLQASSDSESSEVDQPDGILLTQGHNGGMESDLV